MIWTKQDERRLRELLEDNEGILRERVENLPVRDFMPFYTWDALIVSYMKGFEEEFKAAIIARKIVDEFDPNDERTNRHYFQQHISDVLWAVPNDPYLDELFEDGGRGEEIMRYINLKSPWPEGISGGDKESFEVKVNDLRGEVVAYLLDVPTSIEEGR